MRTLRVATYNLYLGADITVVFAATSAEDLQRRAARVHEQVLATSFPDRARAIAALLVRERVDVVGVQEAARWSRTVEGAGGGEQEEVWLDHLDLLVAALEAAGAAYDVHAVARSFRGGARVAGGERMSVEGRNAVLVRRGSGVAVRAERTGGFTETLAVPTAVPGLVLHVEPGWGWVDAEVSGRPFRFVNTHTEAWDAAVRGAQRDELLAAVGDPGCPVVLVGDLNATPDVLGMPPAYVDAWTAAGAGAGDGSGGATCIQDPGLRNEPGGLTRRIDYVLVRDADVVGCRVVGDRPEDRVAGLWPSDHAGVVADLTL